MKSRAFIVLLSFLSALQLVSLASPLMAGERLAVVVGTGKCELDEGEIARLKKMASEEALKSVLDQLVSFVKGPKKRSDLIGDRIDDIYSRIDRYILKYMYLLDRVDKEKGEYVVKIQAVVDIDRLRQDLEKKGILPNAEEAPVLVVFVNDVDPVSGESVCWWKPGDIIKIGSTPFLRTFFSFLRRDGFRLVNHFTLSEKLGDDDLPSSVTPAVPDERMLSAVKKAGADVVILGRFRTDRSDGGGCVAAAELSVVGSEGEILIRSMTGTVEASRVKEDIDPCFEATGRLCRYLSAQLSKSLPMVWKKSAVGPRDLIVEVVGINNYKQFEVFMKSLLSTVKDAEAGGAVIIDRGRYIFKIRLSERLEYLIEAIRSMPVEGMKVIDSEMTDEGGVLIKIGS